MSDMDAVTAAKSDQINADDLVGTEMRVTVDSVIIRAGTEQPITVKLAGHDKVFRPCKTVARIMKAAWGADSAVYKGRSMLLYRDDAVTWGGMKVGGIRVRAISDITSPLVLALQEKKGSKKIATIAVLTVDVPALSQARQTAEEWAEAHLALIEAQEDVEGLANVQTIGKKAVDRLAANKPALHQRVVDAYAAKLDTFTNPSAAEKRDDGDIGEDPFGGEA